MTVEHRDEHIKHFTSELIPIELRWQHMLETGETIPPQQLAPIFAEAKHDLMTVPGPNSDKRQALVPDWFDYWISLCTNYEGESAKRKLFEFGQIKSELEEKSWLMSGLLMLAGGEGHRGHRDAASIMQSKVSIVIFAFEEPEYLEQHKQRGEFLPLEVRLSMWNLCPKVHILSVLPPKPINISTEAHYELLYKTSGASMQFVENRDPYLKLKQVRRNSGIGFGTNVYESDFADLRTTDYVEKLMPDIDIEDMLSESINKSIMEI